MYAWFLGHAFRVPRICVTSRPRSESSGFAAAPRIVMNCGPFWARCLPGPTDHGCRPPYGHGCSPTSSSTSRCVAARAATCWHLTSELDDVAKAVYASGAAGHVLHSRLADYFCAKAEPCGNRCWTNTDGRVDVRGLSELPHHLTEAERWSDLEDVLTDFAFLEQKALESVCRSAVRRGKKPSTPASSNCRMTSTRPCNICAAVTAEPLPARSSSQQSTSVMDWSFVAPLRHRAPVPRAVARPNDRLPEPRVCRPIEAQPVRRRTVDRVRDGWNE